MKMFTNVGMLLRNFHIPKIFPLTVCAPLHLFSCPSLEQNTTKSWCQFMLIMHS